jgi:tetratricopeptide (TPR) repeat protein
VKAENPAAVPAPITATTDDKGRFSLVGLKLGEWTFTAEAPGFVAAIARTSVQPQNNSNAPLNFSLKKGGTPAPPSALGTLAARDLQAELNGADALYNAGKYDESISMYRAILSQAPSLSVINLQIAAAYRGKKEYDNALTAYNDLLKVDPNNDKAKVGIGMTNLEKGDLEAAEGALQRAAEGINPTREVFYNLGEMRFAKGQSQDAAKWYQKAVEADPYWGKPLYKLALVAVNSGDKTEAAKLLDKVVSVDPNSTEAGQAKAMLAQLKQ